MGMAATTAKRPVNTLERVLAIITVVVAVGSLAVAVAFTPRSPTYGPLDALVYFLIIFPWLAVGVLLVFRVAGNPIAWLCIVFGSSWLLWAPLEVARDIVASGESVRGFEHFFFLGINFWVPGVAAVGFLLLLFPDGRLPSPRWKPLAIAMTVICILLVVTGVVMPARFYQDVTWDNPFGIEAFAPYVPASFTLTPMLALCLLASGASMVIRYRKAVGVEKAQLRWLAAAGVVSVAGYAAWFVLGLAGVEVAPQIAWLTIPIAVWFSITRHRLYDLDSLLSRTVGYTLVAGLLGCAYAGAVFVLGQFAPLDNDLAVAMSTLAAVALFNPVRRRVLRVVERRFNRTRYDSEEVVVRLSELLRSSYDPDEVADVWRTMVTETMHPSAAGLWVRPQQTG